MNNHNLETRRPKYRDWWIDNAKREESQFQEILSWDPYKNWDLKTNPGIKGASHLGHASALFFADQHSEMGKAFLRRATEWLERGIQEDVCRRERARRVFPSNLALTKRIWALCSALGRGVEDIQAWRESAALTMDFLQQLREEGEVPFDGFEQADFYAAVRMRLLAGNIEGARTLYKWPLSTTRWASDEWQLWRALIDALLQNEPLPSDVKAAFIDRFDLVRSPERHREHDDITEISATRLEWGGLMWRHVFEMGNQIDWWKVLDLISE